MNHVVRLHVESMQFVNQIHEPHPVHVFQTTLETHMLSVSQNVLSTLNVPEIWHVLGRNVKILALEYVEYLLHVMSPIICLCVNVIKDILEMRLLLVRELQQVSSYLVWF